MTIEPHIHPIPPHFDVGDFVRFTFANDVEDIHSQRYSMAHSALVLHESVFNELSAIDLRGQTYGAIITKIISGTATAHAVLNLTVFADAGMAFHLEGVCHVLESEASCYCAPSCRNAADPGCSYPNFCTPQPDSPPPVIPCPVTNDIRCRWQQAKVGRWFLPSELDTGLPKDP